MVRHSVVICLSQIALFFSSLIPAQGLSDSLNSKSIESLNKIISISESGISFENVLNIISEMGDIKFNYNRNRLPLNKKISVNISNKTIKSVLDYICNLTSTKLLITSGNQLLIVPSDFDQTLKGNILGRIIDAQSKRALMGANVLLEGYNYGTASNTKGFVSLDQIPIGSYNLKISYIGYKPITITDVIIKSDKATYFTAELSPQPILGKEVIVESDYFSLSSQHTTSSSNFSYEEIRRSPTLGGDITRIINSLPSLSNENEANHIVARGGSTVENAFYIDDIQVPTINHFSFLGTTGGLLSILNLDFVNNINVFTGGFKSKYGDRISSVIDISYREGNNEEFEGQFDFNFGGISGQIEGPLKNNSGSWMIAAKHSFSDIILDLMDELDQPSKFNDIQAKLNYNLNDYHKISITDIFSFDDWLTPRKYSIENYWNWYGTFNQIQNIFGATWKYFWGESGYSKTTVSHIYQNGETDLHFTNTENPKLNLNITNNYFQLRNLNSLRLLPNHYFEFGIESKLISNKTDNYFAEQINSFGIPKEELRVDEDLNVYKLAVFLSDEWTPFSQLRIIAGFRADYFTFNNKTDYSPRLSAKFNFTEKISFSASTGIYYQNLPIYFLTQNKNFKDLKSIKSIQSVVGFNWLLSPDTRLTVELYNKNYSNTPVDTELPSLYLLDEAISDLFYSDHFNIVNSGKAFSRGFEVMLQKKLSDQFYGSVSFTYFRSRYKNPNDVWRDRIIDNKYLASIEGGYKFNNEWEISLRWNYAGGMAYTPFDNLLSQQNRFGIYDISKINTERLPDYFITSIRVDKRFHFQNLNIIAYLSIWNFFDRENISAHGWSTYYNVGVNYKLMSSVPVLGCEIEF